MITRTNRGQIVGLLDVSGSTEKVRDAIAAAFNRLLMLLILSAPPDRRTGKPKDLLDVSVLKFGGLGVQPAFAGALAGREVVTLADLDDNRLRPMPAPAGTDEPERPVWIEPESDGGTPAREAFEYAREIHQRFLAQNPNSDRPLIFTVWDGEPTTGDPAPIAQELMRTAHLFQVHISAKEVATKPILFPTSEAGLGSFGQSLFHMSSEFTPEAVAKLAQHVLGEGVSVQEGSRAFVFGGDALDLAKFLEFGSLTLVP